MSAAIKLLIAAAFLNAAARGGYAALRYYELKDETEQLIRFGTSQTSSQLHDKIVAKAQELQLPVMPEDATIRRDGVRTIAHVGYTQSIELLPRYNRPFDLSFDVEAFSLTPPPPDDKK
jgi:hypothetical protein